MALTLKSKRLRVAMNVGEDAKGKKRIRSRSFANINFDANESQLHSACTAVASLLTGSPDEFSLVTENVLTAG
ncbi:DUF1659 domain-containing protein [Peptococcus simiae]|uniref:DUF1659 domain-containing protein n=1 Tax=Peptococcus simiae TaxID=1643805 RepID=UPI00397FD4FB